MAPKKRSSWIMVAAGLWLLIVCLSQRNYWSQNVATVERVQIVHQQSVQDQYHNQDTQITQRLTLRLLTGKYRHRYLVRDNTYYQSQANTNQYRVGCHLILSNNRSFRHLTIISPKRDGILLILLGIVLISLLGLLKIHGLRAVLSAVLNCGLFAGLLIIATQWHNQHILFLTILLTLLATPLTLILIFGYSRQTLISVGATWLSTFFAVIVSTIILQLSNNQGIHYETLNYGIQPFQWIFLAETLLGVLGACMDETTDITASVYQLLQEQPQITQHQLFTSGMHVGREIIGPLINILFYLFLAELIPIIVLYLRNGNTLQFSLSRTLTLGYTQTVISAIGIVLAVPLTAFLAASLLRSKNL